jgi:hypothetical protein
LPEPEPANDIVPRILEQYAETPRGWRILSTPVGEMLVLGPESSYQLKLIPLNPYEYTGAGIEIRSKDKALDRVRSSPEYGLRPLDGNDIESLVKALSEPSMVNSHLQSIVARDPVLPTAVSDSSADLVLTGPVLRRPDLTSLGPDVLRLRHQLDLSADRIFRKQHPMRAGMFF